MYQFSLNLNDPRDKFWLKLEELKQQLYCFSHLDISQDQKDKDQSFENYKQFFSELNWDSIGGGCYLIDNDKLTLSIGNQALLAELLLAAGITFSYGQFIYLADSLVKALSTYLLNKNSKLFNKDLTFYNSNAPFLYSKETIEQALNKDELQLLKLLINIDNLKKNKNYWIKYRISLEEAANRINIHYKQVQILEHTLREKLLCLSHAKWIDNGSKYSAFRNISYKDSFSASSEMLLLLIKMILWHKKDNYIVLVKNLINGLIRLYEKNELTKNEELILCYVLLEYCQIDFKNDHIELANKLFKSFEKFFFKSKREDKLKMYSQFILRELNSFRQQNFKKEIIFHENNKFIPKDNIYVVLLSQSKITSEIEKQKLLSVYDPWLRIYRPYD